jgi:2-polyprenyl-6-methoxyphenol hydroxylase-like FAD-dependent oxidoreductase
MMSRFQLCFHFQLAPLLTGMGANSALFDAWALADWLQRAPPARALACFEREMIARAWVKVRASQPFPFLPNLSTLEGMLEG